jgi:AcrR family transcriptional regulator
MAGTARNRQRENTRGRIVEAAYAQFCARGILSTRMEDVARAAGVSHGTVFLHFKTQEALVAGVIGIYGMRICARMHELAGEGSGVRAMLAAHIRGIGEFEPFYTRLIAEAGMLPEACRSAWVGVQSALSFHLGSAAEADMAAGKIRTMPVHLLFNGWAGLLHYYLMNGGLFAPEGGVVARYGKELLDHYLKLISTHD